MDTDTDTDSRPFMVIGVTEGQLQAFDDIWRASRAPRVKSRAAALRLLIAGVIARGAIEASPNG